MIHRARVLKGPDVDLASPVGHAEVSANRARVLRRALVEAEERAEVLLRRAKQQASDALSEGESAAQILKQNASEEGRAHGYAEALGRVAALARMEAELDERHLSRSVELARVLAERLLGASIAADSSTVAALAAQVLTEVRGARQIKLYAHPTDVEVLAEKLPTQALVGLTVHAEAECARGDFRVVTDIGTMDARLGDRLDLLTSKLAETLRKGG